MADVPVTEREATPPPEERKMFGHLIASKPPREGRSTAAATAVSVLFHAAVLALIVWVTYTVAKPSPKAEEVISLVNPVEEPPPPPPPPVNEPPPPPKMPEAPAPAGPTPPAPVPVETPKGFETLPPPTIVPPTIPPPQTGPIVKEQDFTGQGVEGGKASGTPVGGGTKAVTAEDIGSAPTFTPYTVAPELKNRSEVAQALQRNYPPLLRDSGVGGKVLVWFLIDEKGQVKKTQIKESSGHEALDQAALKVADVMRFSPALNRDQKVAVWVALPIVFQTTG